MVSFGEFVPVELKIQAIVNVLVEQFELKPIEVKLNGRLNRVLARSHYKIREIQFNPKILSNADLENIIRHEVAHFLSFDKYGHAGHGYVWKVCAVTLGAIPQTYRNVDYDDLKSNAVRYVYECAEGCKMAAWRIRPRYEKGICARHRIPYTRYNA